LVKREQSQTWGKLKPQQGFRERWGDHFVDFVNRGAKDLLKRKTIIYGRIKRGREPTYQR